jgi:hypothetical protein
VTFTAGRAACKCELLSLPVVMLLKLLTIMIQDFKLYCTCINSQSQFKLAFKYFKVQRIIKQL